MPYDDSPVQDAPSGYAYSGNNLVPSSPAAALSQNYGSGGSGPGSYAANPVGGMAGAGVPWGGSSGSGNPDPSVTSDGSATNNGSPTSTASSKPASGSPTSGNNGGGSDSSSKPISASPNLPVTLPTPRPDHVVANDGVVASDGVTPIRVMQTRQEVGDAQAAMKTLGLYGGKVDGLNGPLTQGGVAAFQSWWNQNHPDDQIAVDGLNGVAPPGYAETNQRLMQAANDKVAGYQRPTTPGAPVSPLQALAHPGFPSAAGGRSGPGGGGSFPTAQPVSSLEAAKPAPDTFAPGPNAQKALDAQAAALSANAVKSTDVLSPTYPNNQGGAPGAPVGADAALTGAAPSAEPHAAALEQILSPFAPGGAPAQNPTYKSIPPAVLPGGATPGSGKDQSRLLTEASPNVTPAGPEPLDPRMLQPAPQAGAAKGGAPAAPVAASAPPPAPAPGGTDRFSPAFQPGPDQIQNPALAARAAAAAQATGAPIPSAPAAVPGAAPPASTPPAAPPLAYANPADTATPPVAATPTPVTPAPVGADPYGGAGPKGWYNPTDHAKYQSLADTAADKYGVPREIMNAVIYHESGWVPTRVSPAGAIGITQLMPDTAKDLGVNPRDPAQNIDGGARYLAAQYNHFGDWSTALAAYNAGPNNVRAGRQYAADVQSLAAKSPGSAAGTVAGATPPASGLSTGMNQAIDRGSYRDQRGFGQPSSGGTTAASAQMGYPGAGQSSPLEAAKPAFTAAPAGQDKVPAGPLEAAAEDKRYALWQASLRPEDVNSIVSSAPLGQGDLAMRQTYDKYRAAQIAASAGGSAPAASAQFTAPLANGGTMTGPAAGPPNPDYAMHQKGINPPSASPLEAAKPPPPVSLNDKVNRAMDVLGISPSGKDQSRLLTEPSPNVTPAGPETLPVSPGKPALTSDASGGQQQPPSPAAGGDVAGPILDAYAKADDAGKQSIVDRSHMLAYAGRAIQEDPASAPQHVAELLNAGVITQEQADKYKDGVPPDVVAQLVAMGDVVDQLEAQHGASPLEAARPQQMAGDPSGMNDVIEGDGSNIGGAQMDLSTDEMSRIDQAKMSRIDQAISEMRDSASGISGAGPLANRAAQVPAKAGAAGLGAGNPMIGPQQPYGVPDNLPERYTAPGYYHDQFAPKDYNNPGYQRMFNEEKRSFPPQVSAERKRRVA